MSMYPVLLDIAGKICVVIGGGSVAERKVQGLLESGASVRLVSPVVTSELASLAGQGRVEWRKTKYTNDDLDGAVLVFAATDDREVQALISREAEVNGQLLNVADDPGSCNFHVPATMRRGDLTLAVSTSGKSPAVAALIRQQLEEEFGPEYNTLLQVMSFVRKHIVLETESLSQADRKKIYKKILHNDIIDWIRTGQDDKLQDHLKDILGPDTELDVNLPKLDT
jgi:precorrin-2 dehydrogenase/sirohydrochlorin ferrochelatase